MKFQTVFQPRRLAESDFFKLSATLLASVLIAACGSDDKQSLEQHNAMQQPTLRHADRFHTGIFDAGAAEIVSYDPDTQQIFVVNSAARSVDVLALSDELKLTRNMQLMLPLTTQDGRALGNANSVSVKHGILAVAVEAADAEGNKKQGRGEVLLFNVSGLTHDAAPAKAVAVGYLPDMVTITPDARWAIVANEGEPNDDYSVDPEGSVSIIDLQNGVDSATVTQVGFSDFNQGGLRHAELSADIRIFGKNASVAQDLEPEYVAVANDSTTAFISLQENNAIAVINIDTATVNAIWPLGFKDHSRYGLDVSDKDKQINIQTYSNLLGMYQPDSIAAYSQGGNTYLVTANEGDSRDYDGFSEEVRVADLNVGDAIDATALARLKTTTANGDNDADGIVDTVYSYGARSFSIWNSSGELQFDSKEEFAQIVAQRYPDNFNASNDNAKFDNRSDDKGIEPEGLTLGELNGRTYAFIGLERMGGIMVYDITTPQSAQFIQYINERDFSVDAAIEVNGVESSNPAAGDLAPEGLTYVAPTDSPNGNALLLVGNEVSGTTSVYEFK